MLIWLKKVEHRKSKKIKNKKKNKHEIEIEIEIIYKNGKNNYKISW